MVDQRFQRRGIGEAALRLVIGMVRERGIFRSLKLTYVPGPGAPEPFYRGLGFVPTGRVEDGEIEMELRLLPEPD